MSTKKEYSFVKKHIQINKDCFIRIFDNSIQEEMFEWHRDKRKRTVLIVHAGENWQFQYDDQLPFLLKERMTLTIEKETYHKLHKGKGELVIYVKEL